MKSDSIENLSEEDSSLHSESSKNGCQTKAPMVASIKLEVDSKRKQPGALRSKTNLKDWQSKQSKSEVDSEQKEPGALKSKRNLEGFQSKLRVLDNPSTSSVKPEEERGTKNISTYERMKEKKDDYDIEVAVEKSNEKSEMQKDAAAVEKSNEKSEMQKDAAAVEKSNEKSEMEKDAAAAKLEMSPPQEKQEEGSDADDYNFEDEASSYASNLSTTEEQQAIIVARLVPNSASFRVSEDRRRFAESEREKLQDRLQEMEQQNENIVSVTAEPIGHDRKSYVLCLSAVLILIVTVGLSVSLPIALTRDVPPTVNERLLRPTLETVLENGVVRCGVGAWAVRTTDENGNIVDEGPEVDLCRAIAAAVFGDSNRSEIIHITFNERWEFLLDGSIDIVTLASTHTMVRDVYMEVDQGGSGFSFTDPYFYGGIAVGGVPPFGKCADQLAAFDEICRDVRVCTSDAGVGFEVIADFLPDVNVRPFPYRELHQRFIDGDCNAIAGPINDISRASMESRGYFGPYETGINIFSKDPISMATRNDDPEWLDFANWVLRALKAAEEQNITSSTARKFTKTTVFGERFENMFSNAIATVGNYGEFYDRNFGSQLPREGLNEINKGTTGLIYSHPFGTTFLTDPGPGPSEGSTLDKISKRGYLRCGIVPSEWKDLNEDYCLALASSILPTRDTHFENLVSMEDGFVALAAGDIDVLAGGILNLQNDVLEPTTGEGFSFTQPYFYSFDEAVALATTQKDPQWSDFVYWLVASTFYAEEMNIEQDDVADMPQVKLFDPDFEDMFRNAIKAVGNYGDMYARNVESMFPRKGRNLLNTNPFGPQHLSFF